MNVHEAPGTIEPLEAFEARVGAAFIPPFRSKFGALTLDHLDDPGPEHAWLIDGLLSIGDKSVIGGPSQSGKSFLAIHAGMCIATDRDFFGARVVHGLVVYQAGEGARGVKKRLRAWRSHFGVEYTAKTPFVMLQAAVDLYKPDGDTTPLIAEIKGIAGLYDVPLRMVVIDTLATAAIGAEENSARDMGVVMANVARINAETRAHVCLVHHMNADANKLRGSTAIYANIDQTLFVKRNETTKIRTVSLGKQRDDDASISFQFELPAIELGREASGRPITSCVCVGVGQKDAIRRSEEVKGLALDADQVIFMRALFDANKAHGLPVPVDMALPADVRTVIPYEDVKRAWAAMQPSDAVPVDGETPEEIEDGKKRHREALKKRLQRLRDGLMRWRIIGVGNAPGGKSVIWHTGKPLRAFPQTLPKEAETLPVGVSADDLSSIPF